MVDVMRPWESLEDESGGVVQYSEPRRWCHPVLLYIPPQSTDYNGFSVGSMLLCCCALCPSPADYYCTVKHVRR